MNWIVFLTSIVRTGLWMTGFMICAFWPGKLVDVPLRREFATLAFGLGAFNAGALTLTGMGLISNGAVLPVVSSTGTLVVALFLSALMATVWGPRRWEP